MEIILLRHGRTIANGMGLYCGMTDIGLSQEHSSEAAIAAGDLRRRLGSVGRVVTSGMKRATETADLIFGSSMEIRENRDLREYDFGEFEMKGYDELKSLPEYVLWIEDDKGLVCCPGGESRHSFGKRVMVGFEKLVDDAVRDGVARVLVVSHGGPIVHIMDRLFPGRRNFYEWQPDCMKGYVVRMGCDGPSDYSEI